MGHASMYLCFDSEINSGWNAGKPGWNCGGWFLSTIYSDLPDYNSFLLQGNLSSKYLRRTCIYTDIILTLVLKTLPIKHHYQNIYAWHVNNFCDLNKLPHLKWINFRQGTSRWRILDPSGWIRNHTHWTQNIRHGE